MTVSIAGLLRDFFLLVERHRLRFKPDLVMLSRALSHVEAIGKRLDPEFDFVAYARPAIRDLIAARRGPRRLTRQMLRLLSDSQELLEALPGDLRAVLRMVRLNRVEFGFRHRGLEEPIHHIERAVNRAVLGFVAGACLLGSAILLGAGQGPRLRGIPLVALVGFVVAALFLMRLLWSILRGGRL
jgi:ubiquinone biosynthesis protein